MARTNPFWYFFLFFTNCGIAQKQNSLSPPPELNDGIKISTLSKSGINADSISKLTSEISSGVFPNIHSLLIYKNGLLVYENYFPGKDESWGNPLGVVKHTASDLHDVRSISKSVVSACVGIAIAQGKIKNVEQRVFDFFPEFSAYDTGVKKLFSIKHLLTMTSGLRWNEEVPYNNPENSEIQMIRSKDPIEFVLSRPNTSTPGMQWQYNGGTTQLLAAIIEKTTGKRVDQFAREYLFEPLGVTQFEWVKYPGSENPAAASGLRLRPRDLLKFGILYRDKGNWNGAQVIPVTWVEQSFHPSVKRPGGSYGYQFWLWDDTLRNKPLKMRACIGNGDQRIYYDEKNDLLVVTNAGNYNLWTIKNNSYAILRRIYNSFEVK